MQYTGHFCIRLEPRVADIGNLRRESRSLFVLVVELFCRSLISVVALRETRLARKGARMRRISAILGGAKLQFRRMNSYKRGLRCGLRILRRGVIPAHSGEATAGRSLTPRIAVGRNTYLVWALEEAFLASNAEEKARPEGKTKVGNAGREKAKFIEVVWWSQSFVMLCIFTVTFSLAFLSCSGLSIESEKLAKLAENEPWESTIWTDTTYRRRFARRLMVGG